MKICLTPIKNEAWILPVFLKGVSKWADKIIVADQNSSDDSVKIAGQFPKVTLVKNTSLVFNEPERQKLLIDKARKFPGSNILIALDADEILIPNLREWQHIQKLPSGTIIKFPWANICPDRLHYWLAPQPMPFGFIDDGSPHHGAVIHSTRIPFPENAPVYVCKDIKVLHLQYLDWNRMKSKHRWYQVLEVVVHGRRDFASLYRQYHHMDHPGKLYPVPLSWKKNIPPVEHNSDYWWDQEVINQVQKHAHILKYTDIWSLPALAKFDSRRWYHRLFIAYLRGVRIKTLDRILDGLCRLVP